MLDDLARRTSIDPRRVYATGHSNGAMMAYRLGAQRADRPTTLVNAAEEAWRFVSSVAKD